ncbi:hypothetical protein PC116_g8352 [Phytophthora cactorum]|uniref:Uncharacterized protein n=1 Tax=Phytophthora cactorum TaxID=29920 RepID=A0A8T1BTB1_9STRA|nr:hypothetical protein PC112_g15066 [Phytophthora cactorum]KAG2906174.1 hypothetical protein PC115_g14366 [Phytophthora cactorum]KAG3018197.1 hypothetical protein PC120_g10574 [Phytophthora cactorum]KAG3094562.1 hypothetical protein PC121_g2965 [Phytophthora cactorum]KAG3185893.1 hypothetical protein C6341_g4146 [Phytophthora cactorum]
MNDMSVKQLVYVNEFNSNYVAIKRRLEIASRESSGPGCAICVLEMCVKDMRRLSFQFIGIGVGVSTDGKSAVVDTLWASKKEKTNILTLLARSIDAMLADPSYGK